jgi:hypothetical protein
MNRLTMSVTIAMFLAFGIARADESDVQALEKACEAAREERLKPLRDAEIARCKREPRSDAAYCERYWSDYGHATRNPNGTMQPRMFNDLTECVVAEEARRKLRLGE